MRYDHYTLDTAFMPLRTLYGCIRLGYRFVYVGIIQHGAALHDRWDGMKGRCLDTSASRGTGVAPGVQGDTNSL